MARILHGGRAQKNISRQIEASGKAEHENLLLCKTFPAVEIERVKKVQSPDHQKFRRLRKIEVMVVDCCNPFQDEKNTWLDFMEHLEAL